MAFPVVTGYKGFQCTPRFNEKDQLERLDIHHALKQRLATESSENEPSRERSFTAGSA